MNFLQKLTREPNLILGVVTAGLSLLVLFGVDLTTEQMAGVGLFLGALIALVRYLTTPSVEVAVQDKPNVGLVAGQAAPMPTGTPVDVSIYKRVQ